MCSSGPLYFFLNLNRHILQIQVHNGGISQAISNCTLYVSQYMFCCCLESLSWLTREMPKHIHCMVWIKSGVNQIHQWSNHCIFSLTKEKYHRSSLILLVPRISTSYLDSSSQTQMLRITCIQQEVFMNHSSKSGSRHQHCNRFGSATLLLKSKLIKNLSIWYSFQLMDGSTDGSV